MGTKNVKLINRKLDGIIFTLLPLLAITGSCSIVVLGLDWENSFSTIQVIVVLVLSAGLLLVFGFCQGLSLVIHEGIRKRLNESLVIPGNIIQFNCPSCRWGCWTYLLFSSVEVRD
jgi:hypothetical protein